MKRLFNKAVIFMGSFILLTYLLGSSQKSVILSLISIIMICMDSVIPNLLRGAYKTNQKIFNILLSALLILWSIAAFFIPEMLLFFPALVMDIVYYKLYLPAIVLLVIIGYSIHSIPLFAMLLLILFSVIGLLIDYYSHLDELQESKLKELQDSATEYKLLSAKTNKVLQENQDAAVYMATLSERNRIAREIHDNVGHLLTRSILQTGALKAINKDEALKEPLNQLNESLNTAMTTIRQSVHDLHDQSIDLEHAIADITDSIEEFKVITDIAVSSEVSREIKYAFIAIVKEAVNNSRKYSNGSEIYISIQEYPGFFQLKVNDNGTDINISSEGIGLKNIKDRVKALNGTLKITTDNGFKIFVSIIK